MKNTESTGVDMTLEQLKDLCLTPQTGEDLKDAFWLELGDRKYHIALPDYNGIHGNKVYSVYADLCERFGDGFEADGFVDATACDLHYIKFRMLHEIAKTIALGLGLRTEFISNSASYKGEEICGYCPAFTSKVSSIEDIVCVIEATRKFDAIVSSENFQKALARIQSQFAEDFEEHVEWAMKG